MIELTASKVVEALQAQSMTFYLVEGNDITFKHIYYCINGRFDRAVHQSVFSEIIVQYFEQLIYEISRQKTRQRLVGTPTLAGRA